MGLRMAAFGRRALLLMGQRIPFRISRFSLNRGSTITAPLLLGQRIPFRISRFSLNRGSTVHINNEVIKTTLQGS